MPVEQRPHTLPLIQGLSSAQTNYVEPHIAKPVANPYLAFIEAVQEDKPVPVTGIDGRIPVVMGLAARKSYDEHRPVRLDEVEQDSTVSALPNGSVRRTQMEV